MKIIDNLIKVEGDYSSIIKLVSEYERNQAEGAVEILYENSCFPFAYENIIKKCKEERTDKVILATDYNFRMPISNSVKALALKLKEENDIITYITYTNHGRLPRIEKMINDYLAYYKEVFSKCFVAREVKHVSNKIEGPLNNFTLAMAFHNGIPNSSIGDFENLCKRKGIRKLKEKEIEMLYLSYILNNGLKVLTETIMVEYTVPETNFDLLLKELSEPISE